jgi:sugar phosphate isomerase/epimerase
MSMFEPLANTADTTGRKENTVRLNMRAKAGSITRRQAIIRGAQVAATCTLCPSVEAFAAPPQGPATSATKPRKLAVGIATLGFDQLTNAELARELAAAELRTVQLFLSQTDSKFWQYNGRADVSPLTPERCKDIAGTYRAAGLTIHSIGVYTNLIHPDAAERKANLAYFKAMMAVGGHMGVHTFVTEAGHWENPQAPEPHVPLHFQDATWPQTVATVRELAGIAEDYDAKILLEPFYRGFLASAKRVRHFLEEVNSPRVRALLDPANLIEVNDLEEMFQQLSPWIDCLHAKDRKLHTDVGVAAGAGSLDYPKLVTLAAQHTPHAPLVLEYVGGQNYQKALAHLRKAMQQSGIEEHTG